MDFERAPSEWESTYRYLAAGASGLAWAVLWYGLVYFLGANPAIFLAASVVLFAPVLAALARNALDLSALLGVAVAASVLLAAGLARVADPSFPEAASDVGDLAGRASVAWVPAVGVAALLYMAFTRLRRGPKATETR